MKHYNVILSDVDGESVVAQNLSLAQAKKHLQQVRYYPEYKRSEESLDISEDGMTGYGRDETGNFSYNIKIA